MYLINFQVILLYPSDLHLV